MTATVFRQSYKTQRYSLFTLINYCVIVFPFAPMFANGWFTACDGFYDASAQGRSQDFSKGGAEVMEAKAKGNIACD